MSIESSAFVMVDTILECKTNGFTIMHTATALHVSPRFVIAIYEGEPWTLEEYVAYQR